jgi:hypothetical protein
MGLAQDWVLANNEALMDLLCKGIAVIEDPNDGLSFGVERPCWSKNYD